MPLASPRLRSLRRATGVKSGPFADRFGVSRSHYGNIEAGRMPASIELLHLFAAALDVEVEELLAEGPQADELAS